MANYRKNKNAELMVLTSCAEVTQKSPVKLLTKTS